MTPESEPRRMNISEIEALYPNHWILIDDPVTDEQLRILSGVVIRGGETHDEVSPRPGELKSKRFAVHCTRKSPKDLRFLLWPLSLMSTTPSSR